MAARNLALIPLKLFKKDDQEKIKETNWADTERFRIQNHLPGISVFVSINGETVYRGRVLKYMLAYTANLTGLKIQLLVKKILSKIAIVCQNLDYSLKFRFICIIAFRSHF